VPVISATPAQYGGSECHSIRRREDPNQVSDLASTAVTAGAVLLASGLTGGLTLWAGRAERKDRSRGELATALSSFGHALDRMELEIGQLPPAASEGARVLEWVLARFSTLEWMIGQASRHSVGRPALRALDGYLIAANRLLLVAPNPVLEVLEDLSALLARISQRDETWQVEWRRARERFVVVARAAVV
jgi:hypothetical protein